MEVFAAEPDRVSLYETLHGYLDQQVKPPNGTDCVQTIETAHHGEVLQAIYKTFFKRANQKKWCVWLKGVYSTGKSTVIRFLEEIFSCTAVVWQPNVLTQQRIKGKKAKDWATQICTCEEFNFHIALSESNFDKTLQLFEGRGAYIKGNLYVKYEPKLFEETFFIIASNRLPEMASNTWT